MILVTGATGFVGRGYMSSLPEAVAAPSLRGASQEEITRLVEESSAEAILHTAAISDIGTCERNPEDSYEANVLLPLKLAKAAVGRKLICFSSDQVYSACEEEGPYREEDEKPGNLYARQKLEMEKRVLDLLPSAVMLRAEWMYDAESYKPNYFLNILRAEGKVTVSQKQFRGVTYLKEVVENTRKVLSLPGGVYNFGSETDDSLYDITLAFLKLLGKNLPVEKTPPRHNLWMNCEKAASYGVLFSDVLGGLRRCAADHGLLRNL